MLLNKALPNGMSHTEKDRLAAEVEARWLEFQDGLSEKRKYPIRQFRAFWHAGVRYAERVKHDPLLHRSVVRAVNGLRDFLSVERKRVPGEVLRDADRLECILFSGTIRISREANRQGCRLEAAVLSGNPTYPANLCPFYVGVADGD